jgi:vanillate/4-hydroxybenzoate decarboxylase subunit D
MWAFARPSETHPVLERREVDGVCPECGGESLAAYPVLSDGGWWDVVKCQTCLASVSRDRGPRFGSYTPQGIDVERLAGGAA